MRTACAFGLFVAVSPLLAQGIAQRSITELAQVPPEHRLIKVNDHIHQATGFSNTYLITTKEGNVVVDTSNGSQARTHRDLLRSVSDGPVRFIILTHAHPDHVGGIGTWREDDTKVIAQRDNAPMRDYQRRLAGLFARRNAAQYRLPVAVTSIAARQYLRPSFDADITFDREYEFKLGELTFQLFAARGESRDQLAVWIPELKTAFIGDNMYETFPNMYTLRGTEFRSPVDWLHSLEMVRSWKPDVVLGSHLLPIHGADEVDRQLTTYIKAIQHVHDETVKGMNEGKDVYTLMQEITLPEGIKLGEQYGRLTWSIRGIFEGYAGWFDERPQTMYAVPQTQVHGDIVELAGGAEKLIGRADEHFSAGRPIEALHLLDIVITAEPANVAARESRIKVCQSLLARAENVIEIGWLTHFIQQDEIARKTSASN